MIKKMSLMESIREAIHDDSSGRSERRSLARSIADRVYGSVDYSGSKEDLVIAIMNLLESGPVTYGPRLPVIDVDASGRVPDRKD